MAWTQAYDPLHSWILSTLVAALPILVLFGLLAGLRVKPHWCAMAGAGTAVVVAVTVFGMPLQLAGIDRKSTRLNSSHGYISYAVFCFEKKKKNNDTRKDCSVVSET